MRCYNCGSLDPNLLVVIQKIEISNFLDVANLAIRATNTKEILH